MTVAARFVGPPAPIRVYSLAHKERTAARNTGSNTSMSILDGNDGAYPRSAILAQFGLSSSVTLEHVPGAAQQADNALACALNTILQLRVEATRGGKLRAFTRMHADSSARFSVRLGFGLHVGWAVEGALGSAAKAEATYLSPHVNLTARLQTATRAYGVDILVSRAFAECLSTDVAALLRRVDRVQLKGTADPVDIYTFDWCPQAAFANIESGIGDFATFSGLDRSNLPPQADVETGLDRDTEVYDNQSSVRSVSGVGWGASAGTPAWRGSHSEKAVPVSPPANLRPKSWRRPLVGSWEQVALGGLNSQLAAREETLSSPTGEEPLGEGSAACYGVRYARTSEKHASTAARLERPTASKVDMLSDLTGLQNEITYTEEFFRLAHSAVTSYLGEYDDRTGECIEPADWERAATLARGALDLRPNDGPMNNIVTFMLEAAHDRKAPPGWLGYRTM